MISPALEQGLRNHLESLTFEQQHQVVEFARRLAATTRIKGVPGSTLLQFVGTIPPDDLALMAATIEADCGQVDSREW